MATKHSMFDTQTSTPYGSDPNATGGYSASGPSAERAVREAADGTLTARQAQILALVADAGPIGITWFEVGKRLNLHHGQTSALSNLHADGRIAALKHHRRGRSSVYVMPEHVNGRDTRPYGGRMRQDDLRQHLDQAAEAARELAEAERPEPFALTALESGLVERLEAIVKRPGGSPNVLLKKDTIRTIVAALRRAESQ